MTQAAPAFNPVEAIATAIHPLFGPKHAQRWADCAALAASSPFRWPDIGAAFVVWLAMVDDVDGTLERVRTTELTEVRVQGNDGCFNIKPSGLGDKPQLQFIPSLATDAVGAILSNLHHANALQALTLREDSDGNGAVEVCYLVQGVSVTAIYGEPLSPTNLQTQRAISGNAVRIIHQTLVDALAATGEAQPVVAEIHGVGATGPVIPAEAFEG